MAGKRSGQGQVECSDQARKRKWKKKVEKKNDMSNGLLYKLKAFDNQIYANVEVSGWNRLTSLHQNHLAPNPAPYYYFALLSIMKTV